MDPSRLVLAAATGAIIGIIVVVALSWSLRLIGARRGATDPSDMRPRPARLSSTTKAIIVLLATIGYGFIGYADRSPGPPRVASPPPAAAPSAPATSAQITIGGVVLNFEPPDGYCIYPAPLLNTVIAHQAKINPDNVVHTVFGSCDQLRDAGLAQTRIRDFGMLMTPRAQLNQTLDQPELDRIVASSIDPNSVKQSLDQRLKRAQSKLKLQAFSSLGVLERDNKGTAYFAYLFKADTEDEKFAQACIMAMTTIKGRLVSYYLYTDYSKDARAVLLSLLQKAKSGIGDFAARND